VDDLIAVKVLGTQIVLEIRKSLLDTEPACVFLPFEEAYRLALMLNILTGDDLSEARKDAIRMEVTELY